ncbi:hypothetical protein MJ585_12840 [Klebsiella pneumoniae]|nr:hypothetical protein MJ585_12840 [Klebsiella pneumoniae]
MAARRARSLTPEAVAEHAIGMMMSSTAASTALPAWLTRDAVLLEGLTGFTMYGKTAGVIGTGEKLA